MDISEELVKAIKAGQLAVIPTDTIYGIVAKASNPVAVESIYDLKNRQRDKRCTLLIAKPADLLKLGIQEEFIAIFEAATKQSTVPTSFDMPINQSGYDHLHRGFDSVAVRLPASKPALLKLLGQTGPLASTSVNLSGQDSIMSTAAAKQQFGGSISAYWDAGELPGSRSRLVSLDINGNQTVIRD